MLFNAVQSHILLHLSIELLKAPWSWLFPATDSGCDMHHLLDAYSTTIDC